MFRARGSGNHFFLICFWSHGSFHWKALTKWLAVPLCQVLRDTSAGLALRACGRPLRSRGAKDTEGQLRVQLGSYHVPEIREALLYSAVPTKMTYTMPLEAPWESNLPTQLQDLFRRSRVTKSIGTFWQLGFKRLDIQRKTQPLSVVADYLLDRPFLVLFFTFFTCYSNWYSCFYSR